MPLDAPATEAGVRTLSYAEAIREALAQAMEDVADDGAGGARHDADDLGQVRQRAFALVGEEPFGGEAALPLLELGHQRAEAGRFERLDDDLVFRRAGEGGDLAGGNDLHAFLGLDLEAVPVAAPDDGVDLRLVVLEREVAMSRCVWAAIARDLAAQAHMAEAVLERALHGVRKLGDGELGDVVAGGICRGWGAGQRIGPCLSGVGSMIQGARQTIQTARQLIQSARALTS